MSSNYVDRAPEEKQEPEFGKIVYDMKTGRALVEMSQQALQKAQQALPFYDNAMVGLQNELDRIGQQERNARAHPVIGMLSRLAGNLAVQPDMPGLVRGMGMTALQTNPDPDRLAMQKMPIWKELAELSNRQALTNTQIAQTALSGASSMENAASNAEYRAEKNRLAAEGRLLAQAKAGPLTPQRVRATLGADTSDDVVESWVNQSKDIYENNQLDKEAKREGIAAQVVQRKAAAHSLDASEQLKRDQAEYTRLRTQLLPRLTEARANELDQRAAWHINQGLISFAEANLKLKRFAHDIEAFNNANAEKKVRIANDILANQMAPSAEKEKVLADADKLGYRSKLTIPDDVFAAARAGGATGPAQAAPGAPAAGAPRGPAPMPMPTPGPSSGAPPPGLLQAASQYPDLKELQDYQTGTIWVRQPDGTFKPKGR